MRLASRTPITSKTTSCPDGATGARHCGWHGQNPIALLEGRERPRVSDTPERRIYTRDELAQVLAASTEPWRTLFRLAGVVAGRESELLGLWWEDLHLDDLDAATIRFGFQLDRHGRRVQLKTDESKAVLPLPRSSAAMLLEHRARSPQNGPRAFVFATRTGTALSQRNVLRALYQAQQRARRPDGTPTFPQLFEHDERGQLKTDERGHYVPRTVKRRELPQLPDFHALRHTAATDCDDAEEARDLLRHKNSNVTRAVLLGPPPRAPAGQDGSATWKRYGSDGPQQRTAKRLLTGGESARFPGIGSGRQ